MMDRRQFVNRIISAAAFSGWTFANRDVWALAADHSPRGEAGTSELKLTSRFLEVRLDQATGMWNCASKTEGPMFERVTAAAVTSAGTFETTNAALMRKASVRAFQDQLGRGSQALWVLSDLRSRTEFQLEIKLYEQFAGLRIDCRFRSRGADDLRLDRLIPIRARVVGRNSSNTGPLRVLVNGFMSWDYAHSRGLEPSGSVQSYDSVAVNAPALVAGFLSASSAYGTFEYGIPWSETPTLEGRAEFHISLPPRHTRHADPLLILFPDSIFQGLEDYASAVRNFNDLKPKQYANTAWCSWYSGYGRANQANLDALQKAVIENAKLMTPLVPLGVDTLRVVDDSNNERFGDWNFPFVPMGMVNLARELRAMGRRPGVWLAPAFVSETSHVFKKHPEWMQRYSNGEMITWKNFYGNTMHFFDASRPEVLEYLRGLFTRIRNWGYEYVMVDFMYLFGISDHYYNPSLTRAEIYRGALSTIRKALGPNIYLLGCGAPQLASAGLVDGMRIGPDAWGGVGFENVAARYFEAGKWWLNDPDALVGTNRPVEGYRAWVTLAAMSGSAITIGDDLAMLSREKLNILRKILPARGRVGRPLDLFRSNPANVWLLPTTLSGEKSAVLSLFNWGGKETLTHRIELRKILGSQESVLVYDFWNDYLVTENETGLEIPVPPGCVRTFCVAERIGPPQVLAISSYLPQDDWALSEVTWSEAGKTLRGEATAEAGSSAHIAVYVPDGYQPTVGTAGDKPVFLVKQNKNVWVIPLLGTGRAMRWSLRFKRL